MLLRLLLATSTPSLQGRMRQLLQTDNLVIETVRSRDDVWKAAGQGGYDILVISRHLLGDPPADLIQTLQSLPEQPWIIVLSRDKNEDECARLLADGAIAVLETGLSNSLLSDAVSSLIDRRHQELLDRRAPKSGTRRARLSSFVSKSPAMQEFLRLAQRVVASRTTLLITGDTGVGKEWLARAIHAESPRAAGPFVAVNCGALPEALLESELFGHEEGSFSGASRSRRGTFEVAHGGTIFLDEIGEIPGHLQVKLLRVLQSREVQRVGAENPIEVDVRVMAATNRDLCKEMEAGCFRRDLYYRLSVVGLEIPPLKERRQDIPDLVLAYLEHFRGQFPQSALDVSPTAMSALVSYSWPGNVRELINVVERALLLCESDRIDTSDLPESVGGRNPNSETGRGEVPRSLPDDWLDLSLPELTVRVQRDLELAYLSGLLERYGGRIGKTAEQAGITPRSLYTKLRYLGLRKEDFKPSKESGS